VEFRTYRKYTEFRNWLKMMDASLERLPDGSFTESGTSAAACMVIVDKEAT